MTKRSSKATALASPISRRAIDLVAMAHDASPYLLRPSGIARPTTVGQVAELLASASRTGMSLTFRSGGTSLSGQAVSAGVLVDTRAAFDRIEVLDDGSRVRVQPGATVRQVNARLAKHGRRLGPDPASELACTIGGVIANNSSGMACGIKDNCYRTLESLTLVLPSGTILDTGAIDADEQLRLLEPNLWHGLAALRKRILESPDDVARIQRLFSMKNTMGYGLNTFLDFERPVDLLERLMVGSEGTLGWVAEAVFRTVPVAPFTATGLLVFDSLAMATRALPSLVETGLATIELLDATSLRVARGLVDVPEVITRIPVDRHAALLVELHARDAEQLAADVAQVLELAASFTLSAPFEMRSEPAERAALWRVRKGLYPAVAEARPRGTSALLEDVAVPVAHLLPTCLALEELFARHGYERAVIFGHAKDGNIHFMLTERFDTAEGLARYAAMTESIVELVLEQGGTLKAEHGTGRAMAPFVERQYGPALTAVMRDLKRLFDPAGVLSPGVILTEDANAHVRNLKTTPSVEEEVDQCVECGYCEPGCPSRRLSLTPRQRIVVRREIAAAEAVGDARLAAELRADESFESVQSCAVDGMCAISCPVSINTGDLVRRLRAERPEPSRPVWNAAAGHWANATAGVAAALNIAHRLPFGLVNASANAARALLGTDRIPSYHADLPSGGVNRSRLSQLQQRAGVSTVDAIVLPSCTSAMFGPERAARTSGLLPSSTEAFFELCARASVRIAVPEGIDGLCCGTPWKSKGHQLGLDRMRQQVRTALTELGTGHAPIPIVSDAASCSEGFAALLLDGEPWQDEAAQSARVVDATQFAAEVLLSRLQVRFRLRRLLVHPTCSTKSLDDSQSLLRLARVLADQVVVPLDWGCCGFAGDRGLLHPQLTAAATRDEVREIQRTQSVEGEFDAAVSANRTCELGMTRASGLPFVHVLQLLEHATRP